MSANALAADAVRRHEICLPGGQTSNRDCAKAVGAVLSASASVFAHGTELVTVGENATGSVVLQPLTPLAAASELEEFIQFVRVTPKGEVTPSPLPETVARVLLASPQLRKAVPRIQRVCGYAQPCRGPGGEVTLPQAGYDRAMEVFTDPSGPELTPCDDVDGALEVLMDLLADFCFEEPEGRPDLNTATALACLLTAHCRLLFLPERAPIFLIEGNRPGVGKDLLAGLAPVLTTGSLPEYFPPTENAAESRKRLLALARSGAGFYAISNVRGHLDDCALEAAATAPVLSDRILGGSVNVALPNAAIYLVTGNGLSLTEDLARRCMRIRLAYFGETVAERRFSHPDLYRFALANRPRILGALQALVENWQRRGCPEGSTLMPSFSRWAAVIGGVLEAADVFNPIGVDIVEAAPSPEIEHMRVLLELWHAEYQDEEVSPDVVRALANRHDLFGWVDTTTRSGQTKLAAILNQHGGRTFNGFSIHKRNAGRGHTRWSCRRVQS